MAITPDTSPLYVSFPLKPRSKQPAVPSWTDKDDYSGELASAGDANKAFRLDGLTVADIDPRNLPNGMTVENAVALLESYGVDALACPQVATGAGGLHLYFRQQPDQPKLDKELIPGIDIKSGRGAYVVAPNSVHPNGTKYTVANDVKLTDAPPLPTLLARKLTRSTATSSDTPSGQLTPDLLGITLKAFDVSDFTNDNDKWQDLMMACKHACPEGEDEFISWCIGDANYAHEEDAMRNRWRSVTPEVDGGITIGSLIHHLHEKRDEGSEAARLALAAIDFAEIDDGEEVEPISTRTKKLYSLGELITLPEPEWLVERAIPKNGLVVLYGPPKSAKTFLALDMALSIGSGQEEMHGFECDTGKVLYVLAEGGAPMMGNRAKAWMASKKVGDAQVKVLPSGVTLSSRNSVDELIELAGLDWDLVVIDTLARCMDGDENSVKDMNKAIKGSDYIREKTGAAVLLVHHSGKDQSKGMRGSTALLGAVDGTIRMRAMGGAFELAVIELRHGEAPCPVLLELEPSGESAVLSRYTESEAKPEVKLLSYIKVMIDDRTARKAVTDGFAEQFDISIRTAKRHISEFVPLGRENATRYDGATIWREADLSSSSPNAEIIRIETTA